MNKVRNFCFTSYQGRIPFNSANMKYLLQGDEICPTTGREHIQGFVIFKNPRVLTGVRKEYEPISFRICDGSIEQNIKYCTKDHDGGTGVFTEEGERPRGQGFRTDIVTVAQMIRDNLSDLQIAQTVTEKKDYGDHYMRNYRGMERFRELITENPRNWAMNVGIFWGPPGTGKTRCVYDSFTDVYAKMPGKWWDGYNGQEVVLIDDFDPTDMFEIMYSFYLKLLDRYPLRVEIKGGTKNFSSKTIIFTSNFDPSTWFNDRQNRAAFFRRVTEIREFKPAPPE